MMVIFCFPQIYQVGEQTHVFLTLSNFDENVSLMLNLGVQAPKKTLNPSSS
jgi:hypothetical protein